MVNCKSPHFPFIDKLWLFSIAYIVWFHTPPRFEAGIDETIWYIGVAMFFFISGCLFHGDRLSPKEYVVRQYRRLVLPSLLSYMAFYLLWVFFGRYHAGVEDLEAQWYDPLIELLLGTPNLVAAPLWFIVALVIIQSLTYIMRRRWPLPIIMVISICITASSGFIRTNYFNIHFAALFFIWHTLGICFQDKLMTKILTPGPKPMWIFRIKASGVYILACQNYVIGCLKIALAYLSIDLMTSPLYMKFIVAAVALIITVAVAAPLPSPPPKKGRELTHP